MNNWWQTLVQEVVSRTRACVVFKADAKGPRALGGIYLDHGQGGYELPPVNRRKRLPAKRKAAKSAKKS